MASNGTNQGQLYDMRGGSSDGNQMRNRSMEQYYGGSGSPYMPMFNTSPYAPGGQPSYYQGGQQQGYSRYQPPMMTGFNNMQWQGQGNPYSYNTPNSFGSNYSGGNSYTPLPNFNQQPYPPGYGSPYGGFQAQSQGNLNQYSQQQGPAQYQPQPQGGYQSNPNGYGSATMPQFNKPNMGNPNTQYAGPQYGGNGGYQTNPAWNQQPAQGQQSGTGVPLPMMNPQRQDGAERFGRQQQDMIAPQANSYSPAFNRFLGMV